MKIFFCLPLLLSFTVNRFVFSIKQNAQINRHDVFYNYVCEKYEQINDSSLNYFAFEAALKGYSNLKENQKLRNDSVLTIIDFTRSSNLPRFYTVDLINNSLIIKSVVAHGKNSGLEFASSFSNKVDSYESSLGFFITNETYYGKHGYSIKLIGIEKDINNNALTRDIVIHAAEYCNTETIKTIGYLGRSFGCPALPKANCSAIIDIIKGESCVFAYYPDKKYLQQSSILNSKDYQKLFDIIKD